MELHMLSNTCPNCMGNLEFVGEGWLKCPYCESTFFNKDLTDVDADISMRPGHIKTETEIVKIVQEVIQTYPQPDAWGVQIDPEGKPMEKDRKARKNFCIPDSETIYLIYDETMFGSCKEGYALTNKGVRLAYSECGPRFFPWTEFTEVQFRLSGSYYLYMNDIELTLTGGNGCACTKEILEKIQKGLAR